MTDLAYPDLQAAKSHAHYAVKVALGRGDLERPSRCEVCARLIEVIAHHDDYDKPLEVRWLCRHCHGREHSAEPPWVIAARELRSTGKTYAEVARLLGHSTSSVYKRLNPEKATEMGRRSNAKRRAAKREHDRRAVRDPRNRGDCVECGGKMGVGVRWNGICQTCRSNNPHLHGTMIEQGRLVEKWWAEGLLMPEICARLGKSKGWLGGMMDKWRALGFDLPYRYGGDRKFKDQVVSADSTP